MEYRSQLRWRLTTILKVVLVIGTGAHLVPAFPVPPSANGAGFQGIAMPMGMQGADQRFIVMMIPHHDAAIAMADLALTRAQRPEIRALALQIKTSQTSENAQMRRWYRQWFGTDVSAWNVAGYGPGMGMGMPGMTASLEILRRAPDFDRGFIEQMIPHHRMGVMMASHAQWNTRHPDLRNLQAAMVRVQSQEIEQMAQWYRQWYGT
jgi:uncharacterized protein (DUF305 family)